MNRISLLLIAAAFLAAGCNHQKSATVSPSLDQPGVNDEIVVVGQRFHTGTPIVLWTDKGGYNAYSKSSGPTSKPSTPHLEKVRSVREAPLLDAEVEQVKKNGWTLPFLQKNVDQFVIHYDVAGVSRTCFKVLHERGLGVQFMLDIDGTIYQTMDLQEEAAHATKANGRSVGIEIANIGAYGGASGGSIVPLMEWYARDASGNTYITVPARFEGGGVRTPNFVGHPARNEIITGIIQGATYHQYDFTPQQYAALAHLTATLCTVFPKIQCDYPRQKTALGPPTTQLTKGPPGNPTTQPTALAAPDEPGTLIPHALAPDQFENYQGLLGHYHVQTDKQDPGPAFQWDRLITQAKSLMTPAALEANKAHEGQPAKFIPSPPETGPEKE